MRVKVRSRRDVRRNRRSCCRSLTGIHRADVGKKYRKNKQGQTQRGRKSRQIYLPSAVNKGHDWNTDEATGKEAKGMARVRAEITQEV